LEKDVAQWKTRYEVAQAYIDIVHEDQEREARAERNRRKRERQKQKKKPRSTGGNASRAAGSASGGPRLAVINGGANSGDTAPQPDPVEEQAGENSE
jgi:anti-sigma factor RsiW